MEEGGGLTGEELDGGGAAAGERASEQKPGQV